MKIQEAIRSKLQAAYAPEILIVDNESYKHSVPSNAETHFKVMLVSPIFQGKNLLQRHQSVYQTLTEEMTKGGVHALALYVYTPDEWQEKGNLVPQSPECLGGMSKETNKK